MNETSQNSPLGAKVWMALSGVLALLCAFMLYHFVFSDDANKQVKVSTESPMVVVTTTTPVHSSIANKIDANGYVLGWQDAIIGAEAQGQRIIDVRVNVGDWVNKGDVLAIYDSGLASANESQIDANLHEAELSATEAANLAERAKSLEKTGAMSAMMIRQYVTAAETSKARVASIKAMKSSAGVQSRQTKIVAPDSGIISVRNANVGLVTGPGVELFRLIRQGRLEWQAELNASDIGHVHEGMEVVVKTASGSSVTGSVRRVSPTLNPQTNMALAYVTLPVSQTKNSGVMEGMYAEGAFILGEGNTMLLPSGAVVLRDGLSYVFVVNPQNSRARQVPITIGRRLANQVEVIDGLAPNQQVVDQGAGFLNEGDLVQIAKESTVPSLDDTAVKKASTTQ